MKHQHKKTYYNDIALNLGIKLLELKHLHYGYFEKSQLAVFQNLSSAQDRYVEFLLSHIPAGVKKIVDVGCGTGEVAKLLLDKGYEVICIAPDEFLIEKTKEKTGNRATYFQDLYENIADIPAHSQDLILMSESCQYIKPDPGWEQNKRILKTGGYLLVCDFFKMKPIDNPAVSKSGQPYDNFIQRSKDNKFQLLVEKNITENIAPTMDIFQKLIDDKIFPIADAFLELLKRRFPIINKIIHFFFGKKIAIARERYSKQDSKTFCEYKNYFLFLFQKE
jgi:SAM-dependent methyltransferase